MPQDPTKLEQALLNRPQLNISNDPDIQQSISLLPDGFKPTVPVQVFDNPDIVNHMYKMQGLKQLSPGVGATVPMDNNAIFVFKDGNDYQNPYTRAAMLAHEEVHVGQPAAHRAETPAYLQQLNYINQNPVRFDQRYRDQIQQLYNRFRQQEQQNKK